MAYRFDQDAAYSRMHIWARHEGGLIVIGVTDVAQVRLSDVMSVEMPGVGTIVTSGESVAAIESVKVSDDAYSPVSGEVVEVNIVLEDKPELMNLDPYGKAWLVKLRPSHPAEWAALMDAAAYEAFVAAEERTTQESTDQP